MLVCPTSSPKITRMFGFLPLFWFCAGGGVWAWAFVCACTENGTNEQLSAAAARMAPANRRTPGKVLVIALLLRFNAVNGNGRSLQLNHLGGGKIVFQSRFMLTTIQPLAGAASSALSSFP